MARSAQDRLPLVVVLGTLGAALVLVGASFWAEALLLAALTGERATVALGRVSRDPGALALAELIGLGAPLVFAARVSEGGVRAFFARWLAPSRHDRVVFAFVAGLALQVPMVGLSQLVTARFPSLARSAAEEAALRETLRIDGPYAAVLVPLAVVVLAPALEELLFRAYAQGELLRRAGASRPARIGVVAAVAGLFALFHLDPASAPSIFLAGLALGALVERFDEVRVSIAFHVGANLLPVALSPEVLAIRGFNDEAHGARVEPWLVAASLAVFALAYALALRAGPSARARQPEAPSRSGRDGA